jgi:uncharacterized membrane protein YhaH (DUF805 family)
MIFLQPYKRYADFSGRASRMEYWLFMLFLTVGLIALFFIELTLEFPFILTMIFGIGSIIPYLAVHWRRLHDTNRSGVWILITLVPFIGGIWLFVLTVLDSTVGENQYGENPKS